MSQHDGAQQRFRLKRPFRPLKSLHFFGAQHGSQQAGSQQQDGSAAQQLGSGAQQVGSGAQQVGSQHDGAQQRLRLKRPFMPPNRLQRFFGAQHGSQQLGSATQQLGSQPQDGSASQHEVPQPLPQPPNRPKPKALAFEAPFEARAKPKQRVAAARRKFMIGLQTKRGGEGVFTRSRLLVHLSCRSASARLDDGVTTSGRRSLGRFTSRYRRPGRSSFASRGKSPRFPRWIGDGAGRAGCAAVLASGAKRPRAFRELDASA